LSVRHLMNAGELALSRHMHLDQISE